MNLSHFKRVKHRQMPGDVPKAVKIAMREDPGRFPGGHTYVRTLGMRSRAVLKERLLRELIEQDLSSV